MRTIVYDWCIVYWQGPGYYVGNGLIPWQVIVVGGFCSDAYGVVYCRTPDDAAALAAD